VTEIREAPRELVALAVAMRPDWDEEETWQAVRATHDAAWPWKRTLQETTRLLLTADSSPADLRHAARGTRGPRPGTGLTAEEREELRTEALARCEAATQAFQKQAKVAEAS
jgi:hypothetical protein